ncbi:MAG: hypothetical protein ABIP51_06115 [Bacteroidia bacterium]
MLTIPENTKIIDSSTSTMWFNELGILFSISKKVSQTTVKEAKIELEKFRDIIGDKKVCMLVDVTNTPETIREMRDYAAEILPQFVKALGKMLANLFFTLKTQPYPAKMFNNEEEAKEWLKQYL